MKHCFANCLIAFAFSSVLQAYRWSPTPDNDARVGACVGGDVSFPWSIVTDGKEDKIMYIDWLFEEPGKANVSIASYAEGNVFTKENKERFTFTPNAGLLLQGAQKDDAGRYYVRVILDDPKSRLTLAERMVTLSVEDRAPAVQHAGFLVTISDAIWDDVIEDWTLQFRCGRFVDFGHPPVDVIWTMPSGEVRNSSHEDNGTFVLSVSSPIQGGNYSCHLPPSAPAARCLTATSPLTAAAQLYVDDKDVRLSLLEMLVHFDKMVRVNSDQANRSRFIQDQASLLKDHDSRLRDLAGLLKKQSRFNKNRASRLKNHNRRLQNQSRSIQDKASRLQYQDKRLEDHEERLQIQDSLLKNQSLFIQDQASLLKDQDSRLQDYASLLQNQSLFIQDQASLLKDYASLLQNQSLFIQDQASLLKNQSCCIPDQNSLEDEIIEDLQVEITNGTSQSSMLNKTKDTPKELSAKRTFSSCVDWLAVDPRSGVRTLTVHGEVIRVYCDQTTDGGGWTVFQRRQDGSVDFYRGWEAYRSGFGDLQGNFWLGLDNLHNLTSSGDYQLRIDLQKFDGTNGSASYTGFQIAGVDQNFTLNVDSFAGGNAGDSLSIHNEQQFSTRDADHDNYRGSCARGWHGAWWYRNCHYSNLNGRYKDSRVEGLDGPVWYYFDRWYSLKFSEMMMRPS